MENRINDVHDLESNPTHTENIFNNNMASLLLEYI